MLPVTMGTNGAFTEEALQYYFVPAYVSVNIFW